MHNQEVIMNLSELKHKKINDLTSLARDLSVEGADWHLDPLTDAERAFRLEAVDALNEPPVCLDAELLCDLGERVA